VVKQGSQTLPSLYSDQSIKRLKAISSLRRRGIGESVALPQIIVCGDQSVGKSSVLEGITGIPFPRQDGLCTRFATEIILEDDEGPLDMRVSITPHPSCPSGQKTALLAFSRAMNDLGDLPTIIEEAGTLMGLKGYGDISKGPAFGKDVLRIRVSGPTNLHLSVVDLPGIIQVPSEEQTKEDVEAVHWLVDSYMSSHRSIILAVVQAGNDISNQLVIQKSKHFDPDGKRTIGAITKPDLINRGTEARIALLSRNEDTMKLKLGFFLLKSPAPEEMVKASTAASREALESRFFDTEPWRSQQLLRDRVGVLNLRGYLQTLLDRHIAEAIPKMRQEMRSLQQQNQTSLRSYGQARQSTTEVRIYLSRLAMDVNNVCALAIQGNYSSNNFFVSTTNDIPVTRLRAQIHSLHTQYSDTMRSNGARYSVVESSSSDGESEYESELQGENKAVNDCETEQLAVSQQFFDEWIKRVSLFDIKGPHSGTNALRYICKLAAKNSRAITTLFFCRSCSTSNQLAGKSSLRNIWPEYAPVWTSLWTVWLHMWQTRSTHGRRFLKMSTRTCNCARREHTRSCTFSGKTKRDLLSPTTIIIRITCRRRAPRSFDAC
jgi:GTP-binding protein EngB required for normal cell division